jgi:hypothetical protein
MPIEILLVFRDFNSQKNIYKWNLSSSSLSVSVQIFSWGWFVMVLW